LSVSPPVGSGASTGTFFTVVCGAVIVVVGDDVGDAVVVVVVGDNVGDFVVVGDAVVVVDVVVVVVGSGHGRKGSWQVMLIACPDECSQSDVHFCASSS